jgi:hypothetical protein
MVCSELKDRELMSRLQIEQRQRHSYIIVEACFARQDPKALPENGRQQFFRGGFAVRSSNDDNRWIKIGPIASRQPAQGGARVLHGDNAVVAGAAGNPVWPNHDRHLTAQNVRDEVMAVETLPADGKEQIASLGVTRVRANSPHQVIWQAANQLTATRLGHIFQRTGLHIMMESGGIPPLLFALVFRR